VPVYAALIGLVVVLAAVALTNVVARSRVASTKPAPVEPAATATVVRTDLVEQVQVTASIGYGPAIRLSGRKPGVLTWLPELGTVINRGEQLYRVDNLTVPLFFGTAPLYRSLAQGTAESGDVEGTDVTVLQENLVALGFPLVVDGTFGSATAKAVKAWQENLGATATGEVQPGDIVVLPGPVRVNTLSAQLGDQGQADLMTLTGTERTATAKIEPSRQAVMQPGTKATISASGRATALAGTVVSLTPEPQSDPQGGGGDAQKILAVVRLDDQQAAGQLLDGASVTVAVDSERREDVLAVPVGALLALIEGGYAVEVVEGGGRRLLVVTTGLFADGLVEVSGAGLAEGMQVVTTS
jgi:peptidoglycan hydrolase-like protein with peptidoglycan-binding domain